MGLITVYLIIAALWFWYLSATPSMNWKWLVCWTIFMPCTLVAILVGFVHMGFDDFIKWCKKEI